MTYKGHVKNGAIILDDEVELEDGTKVVVEVIAEMRKEAAAISAESRYEHYRDLIGAIKMPKDWSEEHDRYLRELHGP
ncbi:MAG: hypothetical protein KJ052_03275 [Candidatus Hydrogenedentes bacterium]|nr:hypothetical protein [Candidatus Hydrogenedentota bacterium]